MAASDIFSFFVKGPLEKRNSLFWRVWSFIWKDFLETRKSELAAALCLSPPPATTSNHHHESQQTRRKQQGR
jgi:hypothetical protein